MSLFALAFLVIAVGMTQEHIREMAKIKAAAPGTVTVSGSEPKSAGWYAFWGAVIAALITAVGAIVVAALT